MTRSQHCDKKDLRNLEKVRAIFASLPKYINAKTIYTSNNPNLVNFANALHDAFRTFFQAEKELVLSIELYQIKWRDQVVYENNEKTESIAFLFYKDGVGEITLQSSAKPTELDMFVDLIRNEIYNPSAHLDIVSRLWQSEFTNISYRVFDEYADGASGEGRGTGSEAREQPLRADDHPELPGAADNELSASAEFTPSLCPLVTHFRKIVEHKYPGAAGPEAEGHLQHTLESFFHVHPEELKTWRDEFSTPNDQDKLLWLLNLMLDFTQMPSPPPVVRDILDIIQRLVHYIVEEAHIPTLIALLGIQEKLVRTPAITMDYHFLPHHIHTELTNNAFLLSLGKATDKSRDEVREILKYFQLIGNDAVPGVSELLANSKDPSIHKEACDVLLAIAPNDIMRIVDALNLDNPPEARDALYLLAHIMPDEVHPIVEKFMSSPDVQVRECVIEYLSHVGNDEAVLLLSKLLDDGDVNIRIKTLASVEHVRHPVIVDKVLASCFADDAVKKSTDELERMFRTLGTLAGEKALGPIRRMIKKRNWLSFSRTRSRQDKLLAMTALRYIPGAACLGLLRELTKDSESLVRTRALYTLRRLQQNEDDSGEEETRWANKEAES